MNVPYLHVLQRKRRSVERKMRKGKGGKGGKGKGKGGGGGGGSSDVVEIGKILNDVCEDVDDIDEDVSFIYCENWFKPWHFMRSILKPVRHLNSYKLRMLKKTKFDDKLFSFF